MDFYHVRAKETIMIKAKGEIVSIIRRNTVKTVYQEAFGSAQPSLENEHMTVVMQPSQVFKIYWASWLKNYVYCFF
jgi:hypothetical protein